MQRNEPPVLHDLHANLAVLALLRVPRVQPLGEPREIAVPSPGVRDDVECVLRVLGDDGVVDDTSGLVEEDAQSGCIGGKR